MTLAAALETFPSEGVGRGTIYFTSWLQVVPNIGGIIDGLIVEIDFVRLIPSKYQFWLGGSFLGELYYNFGAKGIPLFFVLGYALAYMSKKLDFDILNQKINYSTIAILLLISPCFIWVRGTFSYIPRTLVWFFVLIFVLKMVFAERGNGRVS